MPIDIETFEDGDPERLRAGGMTNAERVMGFLAAVPDKAFTQSEIRAETGVKKGSISVVLSRLEDRGLVRHKGEYWALGTTEDVDASVATGASTRTANDRFGEADEEEWLEYAVPEPPADEQDHEDDAE